MMMNKNVCHETGHHQFMFPFISEPLLLGFWPINQDMSTSDTSGNGFTLINTGVQFDALGINVETAGNAELYLDLTNGPTFRDGQDLSISLWVFLRSEGGILQWIDRTGQNVERIGLVCMILERSGITP